MAKAETSSSATMAKKKCPSDGTEFPAKFNHCPQCGGKVEGESIRPDPEGTAFLDERIRTGVRSVLEETGLVKKPAGKLKGGSSDEEAEDEGGWW